MLIHCRSVLFAKKMSWDYHPYNKERRSLPEDRKSGGRPVLEPPGLDYSDLIDQETQDKRREALLKYYVGHCENNKVAGCPCGVGGVDQALSMSSC